MAAPTTGKAETFTVGLMAISYKEVFRPPTGTFGFYETPTTRPSSGAVYPRGVRR